MIGKAITSILTNDSNLTSLVSNRIFPLLMEEDTRLPAISYIIEGIDSTYVKTSWTNDIVRFTVKMYSKSYSESNTIAIAVRSALERTAGTYATTIIMGPCYMETYEEAYDQEGDTYVISLGFRTNTRQY